MSLNEEEILSQLKTAIVELDLKNIKQVARTAIDSGIPAFKAISEGLAIGMEIVGKKFEAGEYFLSELIVAGDAMNEGMSVLEPYLKMEDVKTTGKVVVGTVQGDLHDIGKNIFISLIESAGFETLDLGIDVPAEKFVEAVGTEKPDILGLSSLLSTSHIEIKHVIEALGRAGLRDKVKIIVGGATLTDGLSKELGADALSKDAVDGVRICNEWMKEIRGSK